MAQTWPTATGVAFHTNIVSRFLSSYHFRPDFYNTHPYTVYLKRVRNTLVCARFTSGFLLDDGKG